MRVVAQYNTSLYIINNDVLDSGLVRVMLQNGRSGRRPTQVPSDVYEV